MKKEPNKQNYKQVYQHKIGWWEVKMTVLLMFIVMMLMLGKGMSQWNVPLQQRLGVTFKEPWQMTETDLTTGRIVYNLLTKPGFRLLAGQLFLGFIAVSMMASGSVWFGRWQWRQFRYLSKAVQEVSQATIRIEVAGTVNIVAENGVIYASVPDEASPGEDRYGFYLATVKISIVHENE